MWVACSIEERWASGKAHLAGTAGEYSHDTNLSSSRPGIHMTQINCCKLALRGLAFFCVLVALVATTFAPTAQAGPPTANDRLIAGSAQAAVDESPFKAQGARHVPAKPQHTSIKKGFSKRNIQLKFVEGSDVELQGQSFVSASVDVAAVNELLASVPELQLAPIFTGPPRQLRHEKTRLEKRSGRDLADLSLYFHVTFKTRATGTSSEKLIDALNAFPIVEFAGPVPMPAPLTSFDLNKYTAHEFASPDGIGATQVTGVAGVLGDHVRIVDIEYNRDVKHQDFSAVKRHEALTRIVPNAHFNTISSLPDERHGVANAIFLTTLNVGAGDVILLEQQTPGPNYPCSIDDQCGLVAIEYDEVVYAAITWATAYGIIVVEAAGNGHQNLDAAEYDDTFNTRTGRPDSGAIVVGAGASPANCTGKSGRPAHSRLEFSNYGEFVDLQGWGECSSASPIVAGAAAAYSSATESATGMRPTSWHVRQALMSTGTAQDTTSQNALEGNIGPLPDLLVALALIGADTTSPTVTAPIQSIANGRVGSTVPIRVSWSASDASGIQSYKLWLSTNGGTAVLDTTLSPTATSHTYRLTVGNSYRFRVRAYDNAGNASAAAYGPTFTPTVTDDRSCCFYVARGGNWKRELQSEAYGGTVTTLYAAGLGSGGYLRFTFTGRDAAYVLYVPGAGPQIVTSWHWPTSGTHSIRIGASGWGSTHVDAIVVTE